RPRPSRWPTTTASPSGGPSPTPSRGSVRSCWPISRTRSATSRRRFWASATTAGRQLQEPAVEPLDETIDHVRGPVEGHLILEYGDYEGPYSRQAFREIHRLERRPGTRVRFAFRHFPLTQIHSHALAASVAAEAP